MRSRSSIGGSTRAVANGFDPCTSGSVSSNRYSPCGARASVVSNRTVGPGARGSVSVVVSVAPGPGAPSGFSSGERVRVTRTGAAPVTDDNTLSSSRQRNTPINAMISASLKSTVSESGTFTLMPSSSN